MPRRRDGAADELQRAGEGVAGNGELHRGSLIFLLGSDVSDSWMVGDSGWFLACRRAVRLWITSPPPVDHAPSRWTDRVRPASSPGSRGPCGWRSAVSEPGSSRSETRADRVQDGGVVAVEAARDLGQRERGELAGQVHRELARPGDARRRVAARAARSRVSPLTAQTASWIAVSDRRLGGRDAARRLARARARGGRSASSAARSSSEAKAITRVIAPSSTRTLSGTLRGDLAAARLGSGSSGHELDGDPPEDARSGSAGRAARARPAGPS